MVWEPVISKRKAISEILLTIRCAAGLGASAKQAPSPEDVVRLETFLPDSPYRVKFRAFAFPNTGEGLNHVTNGLEMGRDGYLYVGIGNNRDNSYAYRFDARSETFICLGNFRDALRAVIDGMGNFGKFHVGPYEDKNGAVWVASFPREGWERRQSGRLFRIDPIKGMEDFGPIPGDQGAYFMIGDDRHEKLYLATRNSHFSIYDIASGQWRDKGTFFQQGTFHRPVGPVRSIVYVWL